ncbi:hypothetical protein AB6A40_000073 [Gnathostoma spinigerum]|uniref:Uncharacterized protein n=1 Tax=Gnathostoma spinigerum TaxID=75299 RepID=A0ABD6E1B3_9BILA
MQSCITNCTDSNCPTTSNHCMKPATSHRQRKRHRPRTKSLRFFIRDELEKELCSAKSKIYDLFTPCDEMSLAARLDEVVCALGLNSLEYERMSGTAVKKIGNIAKSFRITGDKKDSLQIIVKREPPHVEDAVVYLDCLPKGCSESLIRRRAAMFGLVVRVDVVRISRRFKTCSQLAKMECSNTSDVTPSNARPNSSGPILCAFVQFAYATSAKKMCEMYRRNMPGLTSSRKRSIRKHYGERKSRCGSTRRGSTSYLTPFMITNSDQMNEGRKRKSEEANGKVSMPKRRKESDSNTDVPNLGGSGETNLDDRKQSSTEDTLVSTDDGNGPSNVNTLATCTKKARRKRNHRRFTRVVRCRKFSRFRRKKCKVLHLCRYFRMMQVMPLQKFRSLRDEYLKLQKDYAKKWKMSLQNNDVVTTLNSTSRNQMKQTGNDEPKSFLGIHPSVQRYRPRRKRRGRAKLFARAVKFLSASASVLTSY